MRGVKPRWESQAAVWSQAAVICPAPTCRFSGFAAPPIYEQKSKLAYGSDSRFLLMLCSQNCENLPIVGVGHMRAAWHSTQDCLPSIILFVLGYSRSFLSIWPYECYGCGPAQHTGLPSSSYPFVLGYDDVIGRIPISWGKLFHVKHYLVWQPASGHVFISAPTRAYYFQNRRPPCPCPSTMQDRNERCCRQAHIAQSSSSIHIL